MLGFSLPKWHLLKLRQDVAPEAYAGWAFLLSNIVFQATYNIFAKMLTGSLSSLSLLFLSEGLTIFFTFFFFGTFPVLKQIRKTPTKKLAPMLTIGLINGIIGPLLWFTGLHYTSVVNASLFSNTEMMFLTILAVLILKEEWTIMHFASVSVVSLGVIFISLHGFTDGLVIQTGDILLIFASLSFAIGSIIFRKFLHGTDPQIVIFIRSTVPVVAFFALSPFMETTLLREVQGLSFVLIGALIGFGLISRFLNTFTFYEAIERLPVSTVSLFSHLTVIVALLFAATLLNETIEFYHIMGGGLIVLGTLLLEIRGVHPSEEHLETHLTERKTSRA